MLAPLILGVILISTIEARPSPQDGHVHKLPRQDGETHVHHFRIDENGNRVPVESGQGTVNNNGGGGGGDNSVGGGGDVAGATNAAGKKCNQGVINGAADAIRDTLSQGGTGATGDLVGDTVDHTLKGLDYGLDDAACGLEGIADTAATAIQNGSILSGAVSVLSQFFIGLATIARSDLLEQARSGLFDIVGDLQGGKGGTKGGAGGLAGGLTGGLGGLTGGLTGGGGGGGLTGGLGGLTGGLGGLTGGLGGLTGGLTGGGGGGLLG